MRNNRRPAHAAPRSHAPTIIRLALSLSLRPFNHHLYTTLSVHASRSEVVARIQAVEERVVMREGARALPRLIRGRLLERTI